MEDAWFEAMNALSETVDFLSFLRQEMWVFLVEIVTYLKWISLQLLNHGGLKIINKEIFKKL